MGQHIERWRVRFALAVFMACIFALLAGCAIQPDKPGAFYEVGLAALPQHPGDIIRAESVPGAPAGARAWRVLYRSSDHEGKPIAVSGMIVAPERRPGVKPKVVAWAHPTTGVSDRCAPSVRKDFFESVTGLDALLARGYVIAATDYPGLGTPEAHSYLVGEAEARSVLDSVRAATRFAPIEAAPEFAVWGHSQGGHAALFTGMLASSYAPELDLKGVAAAAPATDLGALLHNDLSSRPGKILAAYALQAWNAVYGVPLSTLVHESAAATVDAIADDCFEDRLQALALVLLERPLQKTFLKAEITETPPWPELLARNTPDARRAGAPLFIAQGSADSIVNPAITLDYIKTACASGTPAKLVWLDNVEHIPSAAKSADEAASWITDRFNGEPAPNGCNDLPAFAAGG